MIWLRHWQDPASLPLPPQWIQACNGHRSNPWFLDALRTLLELCDGLASNSFGTHLGYAVHCQRRLHWLDAACDQTLTSLSGQRREGLVAGGIKPVQPSLAVNGVAQMGAEAVAGQTVA